MQGLQGDGELYGNFCMEERGQKDRYSKLEINMQIPAIIVTDKDRGLLGFFHVG